MPQHKELGKSHLRSIRLFFCSRYAANGARRQCRARDSMTEAMASLCDEGRVPGQQRYILATPIARALSSAASTLGGDMGRSVKRTPVAAAIALATAASGGTMGVSPTPRTP
jgi:hypothetical protein